MTVQPTDTSITASLSGIGSEGNGTLLFLETKKKGTARGPRGAQTVYGDDTVKVLLWTGFHYKDLVERSALKLQEMWGSGTFCQEILAEISNAHPDATLTDVTEALQELQESFRKGALTEEVVEPLTLPADEMKSTLGGPEVSKPVFETLVLEGQTILGAKVYIGAGDPENPRSPVPGDVYIDGVKLGELVVEPAANGSWKPKQGPRSATKALVRSKLPVGLYVRYCLRKDTMKECKVGKEASVAAKTAKVPVDPESIRSLFKIAA